MRGTTGRRPAGAGPGGKTHDTLAWIPATDAGSWGRAKTVTFIAYDQGTGDRPPCSPCSADRSASAPDLQPAAPARLRRPSEDAGNPDASSTRETPRMARAGRRLAQVPDDRRQGKLFVSSRWGATGHHENVISAVVRAGPAWRAREAAKEVVASSGPGRVRRPDRRPTLAAWRRRILGWYGMLTTAAVPTELPARARADRH